ncbi:hypothetical protein KR074_006887 [Drosophila pseudoananassae]|nr:hypothetical protein KR074_006887 [Drosophila pseudoananassae]
MGATRNLLIFHFCSCLLVVLSEPCRVKSPWKTLCQTYTGKNGCVDDGVTEPPLPPRDNTCCGPQCRYTAENGQESGPCNDTARWRCLLDTHCGMGNVTSLPFTYNFLSDCQLQSKNAERLSQGYARYLSFPWTKETCEAQNSKCGINCCCRENCPTLFCKFEK